VKTVILVTFIVNTTGFMALSSEWHKTVIPSFVKIGRVVEKFQWETDTLNPTVYSESLSSP
jgi:hypothetical protein